MDGMEITQFTYFQQVLFILCSEIYQEYTLEFILCKSFLSVGCGPCGALSYLLSFGRLEVFH